MSQQVNLFSPIFRKEEKKFSAKTMFQAAGIVIVGIAVLTVAQVWNMGKLQTTIDDLERQRASLDKRADEFRGTRRPSDPLAQKVSRLEQLLAARAQLQKALLKDEFSNTEGYSDYLMALARQHVRGMWLTAFEIAGAGRQLTVQGRSRRPELVPRYIQKLSAEKSLAGINFKLFQMSRPQIGEGPRLANYVEFIASTRDLEQGKQAR